MRPSTTELPRSARRGGRGRLRALLLGSAITAVGVGVLEIALRAAGYGGNAPLVVTERVRGGDGELGIALELGALLRTDDLLGYALEPDHRSCAEHAGGYAIGAWPWRGRPAEPVPDDVVRVVVLGDSCVYGIGVETADTLPERLALELEARGYDRTRVQVLNLGVPGWSTVQIGRELEVALREYRPRAAVLYVAAWNDGAPSTGASDVDVLASRERRGPIGSSAIVSALREWLGGGSAPVADGGEEDGAAPPRVAADEVEPRVRALVDRARDAGCESVVVLPAHPPRQSGERPVASSRTASVRRAATAERAPIVDGSSVARSSGLADERLFSDFVHPTVELWGASSRSWPTRSFESSATRRRARRDGSRSSRWSRTRSPRSATSRSRCASTVSATEVRRRRSSWAARRCSTWSVSATVGCAARSRRTHRACTTCSSRARAASRSRTTRSRSSRPRSSSTVPGPWSCARPGDRAIVHFSSAALDPPRAIPFGSIAIDVTALAAPPADVVVGDGGRVEVALPAERTGTLFVQALVVPRGEKHDEFRGTHDGADRRARVGRGRKDDGPMTARTERFDFETSGGIVLTGRLEWPADEPRAFALFAHCFTCSKDSAAATRVARRLAEHGIAVLRFDFTGLGGSDGDFANTSFSSNVDDLVAAAEALGREHAAPTLLVGHSLGGAAVLVAAQRLESVRAVATIGAPSDPSHVEHLVACALDGLPPGGEAPVEIAGRSFTLKREFLDDLHEHAGKLQLGDLRRALLVMHSPVDEIVSIEHARALYESARHPKSFVSLDGADHLLSKKADAAWAADVLAAWATRYVGASEEAASGEPLPEHRVVVERLQGLHHRVRVGRHAFDADEPESLGGTDRGPSPYDLLEAGLGTCTAMTIELYAQRKKWPLESVRVTVDWESVKNESGDGPRTIDRFERVIELGGDLDGEQRERLLEIANKCPVHRTLTENGREVTTRLAEPAR
ncbi:MAG: alpha/beta fold hydrolase [Planctomycetota bacterium]